MAGKITVYDNEENGRTYWHREEGGDVTGDSGQGYASKAHAIEQARAALQPGDRLIVDGRDVTVHDLGRPESQLVVVVGLTMEQAGALNDFYRHIEADIDGTPAGDGFARIVAAYRVERGEGAAS